MPILMSPDNTPPQKNGYSRQDRPCRMFRLAMQTSPASQTIGNAPAKGKANANRESNTLVPTSAL